MKHSNMELGQVKGVAATYVSPCNSSQSDSQERQGLRDWLPIQRLCRLTVLQHY